MYRNKNQEIMSESQRKLSLQKIVKTNYNNKWGSPFWFREFLLFSDRKQENKYFNSVQIIQ